MWNKLKLLILLVVLASVDCDDSCPKECKCDYQKKFAECHSFPSTQFKEHIFKLVVNGDGKSEVTLESDIFTSRKLNKLRIINLRNIIVKSIHTHAFLMVDSIENVEITNASLRHINPIAFTYNRRLKTINLSNNPLIAPSTPLLNASYVREIVLRNCNIKPTTATFSLMKSLNFIDLTNNGIEELDPDVFYMQTSLEEVDLTNNLITKITGNLFPSNKNEEIENLKLNGNPLSSVAGLQVSDLETLELNNCKIQSVTQSMFKGVPDLSQLMLASNGITKMDPHAFEYLDNLYFVDLSGNAFSSLPEELFYNTPSISYIQLGDNPNLTKLPENGFSSKAESLDVISFNVSHCSLQTLEQNFFSTIPKANELYLHNNMITEINENTFSYLIHLRILDLSNNKISKLEENLFRNNLNLKTLNLAGNPLKTFSMATFKTSSNLIWLDISNCELTELWEIPQEPGDFLRNLQFLNVSFNKLTNIKTNQLTLLKSLNTLDITYNPLECTEQLANLITWLDLNNVIPAVSPTHMATSFSDRKRYLSLQKKEQWEELAKSRCQVMSVQTASNAENVITDDDIIFSKNNKLPNRDPDDNLEYRDDSDEDNENEDDLDTNDNSILGESSRDEVKVMPITFSTYVSVWTVSMVLVATLSLGIILATMNLMKRAQQQGRTVKTSISKKNSGLVYKPLSEDVTEPNTPVFTRFMDTYTYKNGIYKTNIKPENV